MYILIAVLVCILFDIISGIIRGIYAGNINSTYLRKGLLHKATEILTMCGAILFEYAMVKLEFGFELPVANAVGAYICLMEIISILENISEVNPTLGKFFKPYLEKLQNKEIEDE